MTSIDVYASITPYTRGALVMRFKVRPSCLSTLSQYVRQQATCCRHAQFATIHNLTEGPTVYAVICGMYCKFYLTEDLSMHVYTCRPALVIKQMLKLQHTHN